MNIACVLTVILAFFTWETAGWKCFGKSKNECNSTRVYGCDWHHVEDLEDSVPSPQVIYHIFFFACLVSKSKLV